MNEAETILDILLLRPQLPHKFAKSSPRVFFFHKILANEKSFESGLLHMPDGFHLTDAALRYEDLVRRDPITQVDRPLDIHRKCFQVTVVYPHYFRLLADMFQLS